MALLLAPNGFHIYRDNAHRTSAASYSSPLLCSASTRYTVARLTPSVAAIVLADSPLACIRCARAFFETWCRVVEPIGYSGQV